LNVEELSAGGNDLAQPNNDITGDDGNVSPLLDATVIPTSEVVADGKPRRQCNDPTSPHSPPSPKNRVRQLVLIRLTQTKKGFQVPHNGMAPRDILDRELIANGSNNNIKNPVLNRKLNNDEQGDLTYDDRVTRYQQALGDSTRALNPDPVQQGTGIVNSASDEAADETHLQWLGSCFGSR